MGGFLGQDARFATTARLEDWCAGTEVDLSLFARRRFQTPKRQRPTLSQSPHKPSHAGVAGREVLFLDQVLVNPLGGKPQIELRQDQLTKKRPSP